MAGPRRTWKFHNAAEHEWLMKTLKCKISLGERAGFPV